MPPKLLFDFGRRLLGAGFQDQGTKQYIYASHKTHHGICTHLSPLKISSVFATAVMGRHVPPGDLPSGIASHFFKAQVLQGNNPWHQAILPKNGLFHPPERSCPQSVCPQWLPIPPEVMRAQKLPGETRAHVQVQTIPVKSSWINYHEKLEPESCTGQELLPQPGTGSRHTKREEERAEQLWGGWHVRELNGLHAAKNW